jgi:hypothetical protein
MFVDNVILKSDNFSSLSKIPGNTVLSAAQFSPIVLDTNIEKQINTVRTGGGSFELILSIVFFISIEFIFGIIEKEKDIE